MSKQEFWENAKSFPLGLYCDEFAYGGNLTSLPKDCATCHYLRLGKCSRSKIPTIRGKCGLVKQK